MARFDVLVANVAEAGDIVILGIVLVMTVVIGAALLALDTVVARSMRGGSRGPGRLVVEIGQGK